MMITTIWRVEGKGKEHRTLQDAKKTAPTQISHLTAPAVFLSTLQGTRVYWRCQYKSSEMDMLYLKVSYFSRVGSTYVAGGWIVFLLMSVIKGT